ncbi:PadR family transcriptional regulator [candidate division KSB1 bacterium]
MSKSALTILGLLAEHPMHGYEILQTIKERRMDQWLKISTASIYNSLTRLETQRYIEESKVKIGKSPQRNVYRLSASGRVYLKRLVVRFLENYSYTDYPFGLGVAFLQSADAGEVRLILEKRLKTLIEIGEGMETDKEKYKETIPFNWMALIQVGIDHWRAEVNQIKYLLSNLGNASNTNKVLSKD